MIQYYPPTTLYLIPYTKFHVHGTPFVSSYILTVILIILSVLVVLRLSLSWVILFFVNRKLTSLEEYSGNVKSIRLKLFRGRIILKDLHINKKDVITQLETSFFTASRIDLRFQWRSVFHHTFWAEIILDEPQIELISEKKEKPELKNEKPFNLKESLEGVRPFNINLEIRNGKIVYTEVSTKATLVVALTNLDAKVLNFSNIKDQLEQLPATINATADVYDGSLNFSMSLDPLERYLTFDMNTEIKNINLVLLNEFLRAHAGIDVNKGTFGMFIEVAAKDGAFKGYIKPVIKDLDVVGVQDRGDNFFSKLWEGFVAVVYQVLKNKSDDQVATKISIEGKLDNPHINIVSAVLLILKNSFVHAVRPSIDDVIDLGSVRESVSKSKEFVKNIFK